MVIGGLLAEAPALMPTPTLPEYADAVRKWDVLAIPLHHRCKH
jgi:hypothetical protein